MTDEAARELLRRDKWSEGGQRFDFPSPGGHVEFAVFSRAPREAFLMDIYRARIRASKCSFQMRPASAPSVILARLDVDGGHHCNPDGSKLDGTHLHLYNERYGDREAWPVPETFTDTGDLPLTLDQFMDYCHVIVKPIFDRTLF